MEPIIYSILGTLVGGGGIMAWLRYYKKDRAEVKGLDTANAKAQVDLSGTEADDRKRLRAEVSELVKSELAAHEENRLLKVENGSLEIAVTSREQEIKRHFGVMKEILVEIGEIRGSERRCQEELEQERKARKESINLHQKELNALRERLAVLESLESLTKNFPASGQTA